MKSIRAVHTCGGGTADERRGCDACENGTIVDEDTIVQERHRRDAAAYFGREAVGERERMWVATGQHEHSIPLEMVRLAALLAAHELAVWERLERWCMPGCGCVSAAAERAYTVVR